MAKKSLLEMTNGEKYVHYKKNRNAALAGKWASIVTPFAAIFGAKFNEYFVLVESDTRIKMTIGCILSIVVAVFAVLSDFKRSEKKKKFVPVIKWGIALLLTFLMFIVTKDLLLIIGTEFAGQCAATGLDIYADHCYTEREEYKKLAREDRTLGVKPEKKKKEDDQEEVLKGNKWF